TTALHPDRALIMAILVTGGEGGIRTAEVVVESATYRFLVAAAAINARNAVPHCPPLPTSPCSGWQPWRPFGKENSVQHTRWPPTSRGTAAQPSAGSSRKPCDIRSQPKSTGLKLARFCR